jgi:hypothetical protein
MMKRFLILTLCIAAFSACSEEKMSTGDGRNPLADFVLSESAAPGDEAVIQWNGFTQSTEVVLVDASGQEFPAQVKTITSSGLIFTVPTGLEPGEYSVYLKKENNVNVGTLTVLEAEMPVTGITYPSAVSPGDSFIFGGVGLGTSYDVILSSSDNTYVLQSQLSPSGLECSVPVTIKSGVYNLILSDGVNEWPITSSFTVMFKKVLVAVVSDGPYDEGIRSAKEYRVERNEDGDVAAIVYRSFRHEGGVIDPETESVDRYVKIGEGEYAVEDNDISSLNYGFKYTYDSDGMIVSADVHRYSNKTPEGIHRIFTWVYNSAGYPTAVEFELNGRIYSLQDYIYDEDDNLLETNARSFVYDDKTLLNKEYGPDVAHAFDMMHYTDEPFLYVPFLLGEHPHASVHLPDGHMKISGPTSMTKVKFTYEYDADGYVQTVSWGGTGADASSITFEYQD